MAYTIFNAHKPHFYEAFQHYFDGFQKSVGRLRSKKYTGKGFSLVFQRIRGLWK